MRKIFIIVAGVLACLGLAIPAAAAATAAPAREAPFLAAGAVTHHAPGCYRVSTSARIAANRQGWTCSVNGRVDVPLSGNPFNLLNHDTGSNVVRPTGDPLGTQYNMGSSTSTQFLRINFWDDKVDNIGWYEYVDTGDGTCLKEDPNLSTLPIVVWTCVSGHTGLATDEQTRNFTGRFNSPYISLESLADFNQTMGNVFEDFNHRLDESCTSISCANYEWIFNS